MNDEHPPSKLGELAGQIAALGSVVSENRAVVLENTKATLAMSAALRMIYLVPLALAALGLAAWLLKEGKIGEWNFMSLALVCLSPFFGEGIGRILDRMPLIGKNGNVQRLLVAGFILGSLALGLHL